MFLKKINGQEKLTYESQIALWMYKMYIDQNYQLEYEDLIITEGLINQFNNSLNNEEFKNIFERLINNNKALITLMLRDFKETPWEFVKPVIWSNNVDNDYFIENLTLSHRFEIFIDTKFKNEGVDIGLYYGRSGQHQGECKLGIEIKRDMKSKETGNLYIEYAERHYVENDWVLSGIFKKDNTRYFLTGDINEYYIIEKSKLLEIYKQIEDNKERRLANGCRLVEARRGTSLGFIIPINVVKNISLTFNELVDILS